MQDDNTNTGNVETFALDALARGWRPILLHGVTDRVCTCWQGEKCSSPGKHPLSPEWQKHAPMTAEELSREIARVPGANLGIATGVSSGFFGLDVDPLHGGTEYLAELVARCGPLPETYEVRTGSGGTHYYFSLPDWPITNSRGRLEKRGLDVRGSGGQLVAPPSTTDRGSYLVVRDAPVAPAPTWLLDFLRPAVRVPGIETRPWAATDGGSGYETYARAAVEGILTQLEEVSEWDNGTFLAACNLVELANAEWNSFTLDELEQEHFKRAPRDNNFGDQKIAAKWRSALGKIGDNARPLPILSGGRVFTPTTQANGATPGRAVGGRALTEMGNAERLLDAHQGEFYCLTEGARRAWWAYDGGTWVPDHRNSIEHAAKEMARGIPLECGPAASDEVKKAHAGWGLKSETAKMVAAAVRLLSSDPAIARGLEEFDRDVSLLNFSNGTLEIGDRAGVHFRSHSPADMLTQSCGYDYDPGAVCPTWDRFLREAVPDLAERSFLQRMAGYSLTGLNNARAMAVLVGLPGTGKSKFTDGLMFALGSYGMSVPTGAFAKLSGDKISNDVKDLDGKRFLAISETDHDQLLNESLLKAFTGGDAINARRLYANNAQFRPVGVLWLATNNKPQIRGDDAALWTRIYPIRFDQQVALDRQDIRLGEKLFAERAGIMNWALRGMSQYLATDSLCVPDGVMARRAEFMAEQDPVADWIEEECIREAGAFTPLSVLNAGWTTWNLAQGQEPGKFVASNRLGAKLESKGFHRMKARDPWTHTKNCRGSDCDVETHNAVHGVVGLTLPVRLDEVPGGPSFNSPSHRPRF